MDICPWRFDDLLKIDYRAFKLEQGLKELTTKTRTTLESWDAGKPGSLME
jgi:hypothetical protein